jgi:hypothetical protein
MVVVAPQERIDDFERTAVEFFRAVLGKDYSDCIVTDESRLSDLASCGPPEDIADATESLKALLGVGRVGCAGQLGCTSCFCAISATVLPSRNASTATLALNAAEWFRRGLLLICCAPVMWP